MPLVVGIGVTRPSLTSTLISFPQHATLLARTRWRWLWLLMIDNSRYVPITEIVGTPAASLADSILPIRSRLNSSHRISIVFSGRSETSSSASLVLIGCLRNMTHNLAVDESEVSEQ